MSLYNAIEIYMGVYMHTYMSKGGGMKTYWRYSGINSKKIWEPVRAFTFNCSLNKLLELYIYKYIYMGDSMLNCGVVNLIAYGESLQDPIMRYQEGLCTLSFPQPVG